MFVKYDGHVKWLIGQPTKRQQKAISLHTDEDTVNIGGIWRTPAFFLGTLAVLVLSGTISSIALGTTRGHVAFWWSLALSVSLVFVYFCSAFVACHLLFLHLDRLWESERCIPVEFDRGAICSYSDQRWGALVLWQPFSKETAMRHKSMVDEFLRDPEVNRLVELQSRKNPSPSEEQNTQLRAALARRAEQVVKAIRQLDEPQRRLHLQLEEERRREAEEQARQAELETRLKAQADREVLDFEIDMALKGNEP